MESLIASSAPARRAAIWRVAAEKAEESLTV
jgi:hypothetical protein